jgi:hypothetical protein
MGVDSSLLLPSLAVSLGCLIGVLVLMAMASSEARRRAAPAAFFILSLSVVLSALTVWSVLI